MIDAMTRQQLLASGYTDAEIEAAIVEIQNEKSNNMDLQRSYQNTQMLPRVASNTIVAGQNNQENLIKWQVELDSILERVEHILRGDRPTSVNGSIIFVPPENPDEMLFNSYGVAEIMRILSMYLNRNTILSNYDEDTINWKILDFGVEVSDLIYMKYEDMGMDTLAKRKRYPMIVRELVDTTHSGYLRALNGGERDSLRTARNISQNQTINEGGLNFNPNGGGMMKERSIINPMRWIRSKYG